ERRIAVEKTDTATTRHGIFILDLTRKATSRLLFDPAGAHEPVWSPDGGRIAFVSNRFSGGIDMLAIRADGAGVGTTLARDPEVAEVPTDWSLDGRLILYHRSEKGQSDLWVLPMSPPGPPQPFLQTSAKEVQGQFSPD